MAHAEEHDETLLVGQPASLSPLQRRWDHVSFDTLLPPLAEVPTHQDYVTAFNIRAAFAALFEAHVGHRAFFQVTFGGSRNQQRREVMTFGEAPEKIREQNDRQLECMKQYTGNVPAPSQLSRAIGSLTGGPAKKRPFCNLVLMAEVDSVIHAYVRRVEQKMAAGCRTDSEGSSGIIYLASKPAVWEGLDPLRRAHVVLLAKLWLERMTQKAVEHNHRLQQHQSQAANTHPLSLPHAPALTARQSRRSGVSAEVWGARWA